jgi:unsaturated rhamnogalacturonyl hydrolase
MKKILILLITCAGLVGLRAQQVSRSSVLEIAERVFDWQQQNPTGKDLWEWEYGAYYSGVMDLYQVDPKIKYLKSMAEMGNKYNWSLRPRPYDANVFAIGHMYIDLYDIMKDPKMIENTGYCLDANFQRDPRTPDITFKGNKYWFSWWSWCDALFMAPPTYTKYAAATGQIKYLEKMDELFKLTYDYLYDKEEKLFFRDDTFFDKKTPTGKKVFWSRGNGWVIAGLSKVLKSMPKDFKNGKFYENLFIEMASRLKDLQVKEGYWPSSLLDPSHYSSIETSGTSFYCYALAYGINNGYLKKTDYLPVVEKAWNLLVKCVQKDGKLGYVQQVGDSPAAVKAEDSESYGSGAFLSAASEMAKLSK